MTNKCTGMELSHRCLMILRFARSTLRPCKALRSLRQQKNMTDDESEGDTDDEPFN